MNIEDLIREANPVRTSDLAAGDSPPAQRALAQILQAHAAPTAARRSRPSRRGRKRTLITVGLAFTAAGAMAAVLVSALPGQAPHAAHHAAPAPGARARTAQPMTARQVLLTAAAHVVSTPATGRYWRVQQISGLTFPGGTKAHPYDISLEISYDQWNPKSAGRKYWLISQELGTVPATPADVTAWRAAESPTTWRSGQWDTRSNGGITTGGVPWARPLATTAAASAPGATWAVSDGTVGYVEGNLAGLKAAQFRQMPTSPQGVAAMLRHYYAATGCAAHAYCSAEDQIIWSEALFLLQDPVSAQVRSATFKVMASLPGVRLLGPMTDPLGRRGYALAAGPQDPGYPNFSPVRAVVIDPRTGSLLATEDIAPMPRNVQCMTIGTRGSADHGKPVTKVPIGRGKFITGMCIGPSYEGRSYQGQVDDFTVLVKAGWTNASPVLPRSTHEDLPGFPGLPPAGDPPGLPALRPTP
jgi:hypothetical protein